MIKVGAIGDEYSSSTHGKVFDDKGRTKISQIFISHDHLCIRSIQFQYVEDGDLVLSPLYGANKGSKFDVISFDLDDEILTRVSGSYIYEYSRIGSLKFDTNRGTYGPFGIVKSSDIAFDFCCGNYSGFGGFHGTADDGCLRKIGIYINPRKSIKASSAEEISEVKVERATQIWTWENLSDLSIP
ncbi:hypothetical protein Tsubulata_026880 [Turnera subulata]|uniref:Jacalin-type lectin domain-containing protein n=1 Tax=Turnera subulata TaxID=218843 RepID=A0A9Q0FID9_9ROSI|nr:hypothetical protein Tsubulata_026880 [Turnera subulata]